MTEKTIADWYWMGKTKRARKATEEFLKLAKNFIQDRDLRNRGINREINYFSQAEIGKKYNIAPSGIGRHFRKIIKNNKLRKHYLGIYAHPDLCDDVITWVKYTSKGHLKK